LVDLWIDPHQSGVAVPAVVTEPGITVEPTLD